MSINYNDAAKALLCKCGFHCEPEPEWVDGRTPDFLCSGRFEFWAEVKSLNDPDQQRLLNKFTRLRERGRTVEADGRVLAVVSDDASDKDFKSALAMVDRVLASPSGTDSEEIVAIPRDPDYGRHVRITTSNGDFVLHSCMSRTGCYGAPLSNAGHLDRDGVACVRFDDGNEQQVRVGELGLDKHDNILLALKILTRQGPGFTVQSAMGSGMALSPLPHVQKFRNAARDANKQFKNACRHRNRPCLLMIFHDDPLVVEDVTFLSAFYGDHQVTWSRDAPELKSESFGRNGIWSETDNRTTSAACYVRNSAQPILVHNYWAMKPLSEGLLGGVEYRALDNGSLEETVPGEN